MKSLFVCLAAALLGAAPAAAQQRGQALSPACPGPEEKIYTYVEQMPELLTGGGLAALQSALLQRVPAALRRQGEGRVFVQFVVSRWGAVCSPTIIKSTVPAANAAVLAAVAQLPRLRAGRQNYQPVAVSYTVVLAFGEVVKTSKP